MAIGRIDKTHNFYLCYALDIQTKPVGSSSGGARYTRSLMLLAEGQR